MPVSFRTIPHAPSFSVVCLFVAGDEPGSGQSKSLRIADTHGPQSPSAPYDSTRGGPTFYAKKKPSPNLGSSSTCGRVAYSWVVVPTGERSANTGQLTCAGWAQSVGLPNTLEQFGPFHGAIASQDAWEEFGDAKFYWNNSAQAMLIPFASRWDIPIWMDGASDNPAPTWSALFQWSFAVGGNATLVVAWDDSTLPDFLTGWVDGLIKAKTLDGLQGLGWKQKMASWPKSEPHVGLMEYTIKNGTLQNFSWRFVKTKVSGSGLSGCSK